VAWTRGLLLEPSQAPWWAQSHLGAGFGNWSGGRGSLIVGGRAIDNRSRLGELTVTLIDGVVSVESVSPQPLEGFSSGNSFYSDGVSYPWLIEDDRGKSMLFTGWKRRNDGRFWNHLGIAAFSEKLKIWCPQPTPILPDELEGTGSAAAADPEGSQLAVTVFSGWEQVRGRDTPMYQVHWASLSRGKKCRLEGPIEGLPRGTGIAVARPSFLATKRGLFAWFSVRVDHDYHVIGGEIIDGKFIGKPTLDLNPSGIGWDANSCEYAHVSISGDYLVAPYNGDGFGKTGIGLAVMPLDSLD